VLQEDRITGRKEQEQEQEQALLFKYIIGQSL
jgi:hypothetical protein